MTSYLMYVEDDGHWPLGSHENKDQAIEKALLILSRVRGEQITELPEDVWIVEES